MLVTDWTTVQTTTTTLYLYPPRERWIELADSDDIVLFLDVREQSGSALWFRYEASPTEDENSFLGCTQFSPAVSSTPRVDMILGAYSAVPGSRYVRWRIWGQFATPADITFRVAAALYGAGL
jgi:hypothetical protein